MNCYEHTDTISVAACACGRGLCGTCQAKHQPPTCEPCYTAAIAGRIAKTQQRLFINCGFAVAYIVAFVQMHMGDGSVSTPIFLLLGVWGFFGFRWLLDGLLGASRLAIFATGQTWVITYIIGSLLCSIAGFVIVPVEIVLQWRLLKRLKAEAGTTAAPTAALGATS